MPGLLVVGGVMIIVFVILLGSVYTTGRRPHFRIVHADGKYVIQYRTKLYQWKTYMLPATDVDDTVKAAVYYTRTEAEDMIKRLIERFKEAGSYDKLARGKTVQVFEYTENGELMGNKRERVE